MIKSMICGQGKIGMDSVIVQNNTTHTKSHYWNDIDLFLAVLLKLKLTTEIQDTNLWLSEHWMKWEE